MSNDDTPVKDLDELQKERKLLKRQIEQVPMGTHIEQFKALNRRLDEIDRRIQGQLDNLMEKRGC